MRHRHHEPTRVSRTGLVRLVPPALVLPAPALPALAMPALVLPAPALAVGAAVALVTPAAAATAIPAAANTPAVANTPAGTCRISELAVPPDTHRSDVRNGDPTGRYLVGEALVGTGPAAELVPLRWIDSRCGGSTAGSPTSRCRTATPWPRM
jgi:hypothetical protein